MTQEYPDVFYVSAAQCHGEQENRHFLHGGEEDRGQRGEATDKPVQCLPLRWGLVSYSSSSLSEAGSEDAQRLLLHRH